MTNEVLQKTGACISLADHAGDFNPAAANVIEVGAPTNVQLSLASVASTAARQSAKFDFGATRGIVYTCVAALEFASGVVAGETVDLYLAPSPNSTAANGNPGGVSGSDAAYSGTSGSTIEESVKQLRHIGSFTATDDVTTTIQIAHIGQFVPPERYGSVVVVNNTTPAFHSDDVEMNIVFIPQITEIQDAP
jgi:hypothetical protein